MSVTQKVCRLGSHTGGNTDCPDKTVGTTPSSADTLKNQATPPAGQPAEKLMERPGV